MVASLCPFLGHLRRIWIYWTASPLQDTLVFPTPVSSQLINTNSSQSSRSYAEYPQTYTISSDMQSILSPAEYPHLLSSGLSVPGGWVLLQAKNPTLSAALETWMDSSGQLRACLASPRHTQPQERLHSQWSQRSGGPLRAALPHFPTFSLITSLTHPCFCHKKSIIKVTCCLRCIFCYKDSTPREIDSQRELWLMWLKCSEFSGIRFSRTQ